MQTFAQYLPALFVAFEFLRYRLRDMENGKAVLTTSF
jgi:hypothetical protein